MVKAYDVLAAGTGICFAKFHLLATLLRGLGIPTGFCYQRVMRRGGPASGCALHGLNAVCCPATGWIRLDRRENRPAVDAQFNLHQER